MAGFFSRSQYRPVDGDAEAGTANGEGGHKRGFGLPALTKRTLAWVFLAIVIIALLGVGSKPAKEKWDNYKYPSTWDNPSDGISDSKSSVAHPPPAGQPPIPLPTSGVDWSQFAYIQYVTNGDYLCNSVMLFEILHRLGAKADKLMMYPDTMHYDRNDNAREAQLLLKARDEYGVRLKPIHVVHRAGGDPTWADSYTKLLAFNQTEYKRVLMLDSDSTVLKPMDELFTMPSAPVAMPRAYWGPGRDKILSSQLLLVEPSEFEYARIDKAIQNAAPGDFDMELVNYLYYDSCLILPHRPYDLLTGEFRSNNHTAYLGNDVEEWDPDAILAEASFLHFSDWPVPKPWLSASSSVIQAEQPKCVEKDGKQDCRNQKIWLNFYDDFKERRSKVCDMGRRRATRRDMEYTPGEPIFGQNM